MMSDQLNTIRVDEWTIKLREPEIVEQAPVVLLLHGWTGDENSMWVFAKKLSEKALLVAPRGLYPSRHANLAGFSWVEETLVKWADRQDFEFGIGRLNALIDQLSKRYPANFETLNPVGFSQGAALTGAYLLSYPEKVRKLAMLSGFLPAGVSPSDADLADVDIFIGHGSLDATVPEEKAQEANLLFQAAGGNVRYCLTEVGHKLGADCFRAFNHFFKDL